jgi:hypothetical protein
MVEGRFDQDAEGRQLLEGDSARRRTWYLYVPLLDYYLYFFQMHLDVFRDNASLPS